MYLYIYIYTHTHAVSESGHALIYTRKTYYCCPQLTTAVSSFTTYETLSY